MPSLVAFLDMLGTQESIKSGKFDPWDTIEFANPVGLAAIYHPDMHFAVFSDSVVISSPLQAVERFVAVISHLLGNWFSEGILARGGVAVGDIEWVNHSAVDGWFRQLENFHYARVYGSGLVEAIELERSSGPGAICFMSGEAAQQFTAVSPNYVLGGLTPMLVWADERRAHFLHRLLSTEVGDEMREAKRRHLQATVTFCEQIIALKKFVDPALLELMFDTQGPPNKALQPTSRKKRQRKMHRATPAR